MSRNLPHCHLDYWHKKSEQESTIYHRKILVPAKLKKIDKSLFVALIVFFRKVFIAFSVLFYYQ